MCVCFPIIFYCHSSNMGEQIVHKNLYALRALNIKRIGWGIWDPFAGFWSTCSHLHKLQKLSCLICISLAYIFDFISLRKILFLKAIDVIFCCFFRSEEDDPHAAIARRNQTTAVILCGVIGALFDLEQEQAGTKWDKLNNSWYFLSKCKEFLFIWWASFLA